jgi:HemY protein
MIRLFLLALMMLAAGAGAAFYLRAETGYVLISYRDWLVETSLLGLVLSVSIGCLALYYGLKLLAAGVRLPDTLRRAAERRRATRARDSFERGLLQLLEGHWKLAEIELVRRAADHHARHLNYLGAARAAQRMGAGDRRDHYLKLALQSAPELAFATLLTQAELQRERGEHTLVRDTALKLRLQDANHPYAVELLAESYAAIGDWAALRELLAETARLKALAPMRYRELMLRALQELLAQALAAARLDQFKAVWEAAGERFRAEPELRRGYARGLARLNADAEALALVAATLKKEWDAELVALYGELHASDTLSQLATIEGWLGQYGEKPELLTTAGRVCLRNKLWGKARSYLEAVLRVAPTPVAYMALAELCAETQNGEEASKFYRQGLELAARGVR